MRAGSTAASAVRHTLGAAFEAFLIVAIVAALAFGLALASGHPFGADSVFAAKGGNGRGDATSRDASCSVSPSPVAVGELYTVTAAGLPSDTSVNVRVSGSGGSNLFMRITDGAGSTSVAWYATWSGTNDVTFASDSRSSHLLASCSFSVS